MNDSNDNLRRFTFHGHLISRIDKTAFRIEGEIEASSIDEAVAEVVPRMHEHLLSAREEPGREGKLAQLKEIRLTVADASLDQTEPTDLPPDIQRKLDDSL